MTSILSKDEVSKAQFGPRQLKDPRSRAYAIQTLYALKLCADMVRCDKLAVARELAEIEQYRHWEVLGYESKQAMLEAELSEVGIENVEIVLNKREIGIEGGKPGPGRGKKTDSVTTRLGRGIDYQLARLARDHEELAAEVKAGKLSANAAAIKAGFRKATWTAPCDPELLAKAIERRFPGFRLVRIERKN